MENKLNNNESSKLMSFIKTKLSTYLLFLIIVSLFAFIYAILIYYNKLSNTSSSFNTITFILGIILFLILGFISGLKAKKNGLLEGLTAALIIMLLTLLINLIVKQPFETRNLIKIATYLTSSGIGGIIGVNLTSHK